MRTRREGDDDASGSCFGGGQRWAGEAELLHCMELGILGVPCRAVGLAASLSRCAVPSVRGSVVDRHPPAPFGSARVRTAYFRDDVDSVTKSNRRPGHDELARRRACCCRRFPLRRAHDRIPCFWWVVAERPMQPLQEKVGARPGRPQASRLVWTRAADGRGMSVTLTRVRRTRRGKGETVERLGVAAHVTLVCASQSKADPCSWPAGPGAPTASAIVLVESTRGVPCV